MERQELVLMGVLTLQQQLYGAPRRQGDAGGGEPAAEATGRPAGLRQQFAVLLRRHELPAHSHLWNLLPPARRPHVHDLEQVGHDTLRAARPRLCRRRGLGSPRAAAAADGPVPTRVAVLDRDEDLPLRKGPAVAERSPLRPGDWEVELGAERHWQCDWVLLYLLHLEWTGYFLRDLESDGKYAHQSGKTLVLLVCSPPMLCKSVSEWEQGVLTANVRRPQIHPKPWCRCGQGWFSWPFKVVLFHLFPSWFDSR